ncbi:MAG: ribosomal RNA small subunit methyltransferase A [Planctomycetaceae bacterium]|nr:ribosomal RNA small subunit methyltransferase A [Planctomycetaceae bacterium]
MRPIERQTRSHLMSLFQHQGIHPRHDLGQNFLIDLNLLDYIVDQAQVGPQDVVLEIGSGTGGLTAFLAQSAGEVVSVEIDPRVQEFARAATSQYSNVTLLRTDALRNKNHLSEMVLATIAEKLASRPGRTLKLVANLPYCIATPVISNLVATDLPWSLMIVTIQWELAQRMRAAPGSDDYSALSVWLQSQCDLKVLKKLGPKVFWPRPQVDSAIVRVAPDPLLRESIGDRQFFHEFVRRLFSQRRKSLRSVVVGMYRKQMDKSAVDAALNPLRLPDGARAEQLDIPTLVRLSQAMQPLVKGFDAVSEEESDE